jgi:hypothetical protein
MDGRRQTEEHVALSARTSDGQVKGVTGTRNKNTHILNWIWMDSSMTIESVMCMDGHFPALECILPKESYSGPDLLSTGCFLSYIRIHGYELMQRLISLRN